MSLSPKIFVIIGCGKMGRWFGYRLARAGHQVYFIETKPSAIDAAKQHHGRLATADFRDPARGAEVLGRLHFVSVAQIDSPDAIATYQIADYVIEAVPEKRDLKTHVLSVVSAHAKPEAILTTTASSLMMVEVDAGCSRHRGRTMNLHFFPEPRLPVELMAGTETPLALLEEVALLLRASGFIPFLVRGLKRGFLFNYIWHLIKMGCLQMYQEGLCSHEEFDRLWCLNFGMPYGPFAIMDLVGLDVVLDVATVYWEEDPGRNFEPPQFLRDWVAAGRTGQAAGQGFYQYPNPSFAMPDWLTGEVDVRKLFLGSWALTSFVAADASGTVLAHPMGEDATGVIHYMANGQMSVCLSAGTRSPFASPDPQAGTEAERAEAFASFLSYFGSFEIQGTEVVHTIAHCQFPNWKGSEQRREFRFDGSQLILSTPLMPSARGEVSYVLTWKKQ